MSQIVGIDHSAQIISALERQLNNKGVRIHSQDVQADGTHLVVEGMGNKKRASLLIPKLDNQPSEQEASALVRGYLADLENGLRAAPAPVEGADGL